ncbi:MAG: hypothetical protein ACT4UP_00980 [Gammaproteobacteria bacterium]
MHRAFVAFASLAILAACGPTPEERERATAAFATVEIVFQHPRCANCHIPGDAPGAGWVHPMGVLRGPEGHGAPGLPCSTCHGEDNPPDSFGPHAPPGAPHWGLPPPEQKMAWFGLNTRELCEMIQDENRNGDRDLDDLVKHVTEDKLVLWGWNPGAGRAPVPVPHAEFVARFREWADGDAPCPA